MDKDADRKRLGQVSNFAKFQRNFNINDLIDVWLYEYVENHHMYFIRTTLVPNELVEKCLTTIDNSMPFGAGKPSVDAWEEEGDLIVNYSRFGNDEGFEPLILQRHFNGLKPDDLEIAEDFRLYHNLYFDKTNSSFIKFDGAGNDQIVGELATNSATIRLREIREYLAAKRMHLSFEFDWREISRLKLEELGLEPTLPDDHREGMTFFGFEYRQDSPGSFSRLVGKLLIPPIPDDKSGIYGLTREIKKKVHRDFIIGVTKDGENIFSSSEPGSQRFLTAVDFSKTVLDKYYAQPSKYKVEDGYLRCGNLWGVTIDNHHDEKVTAWLGDLGNDLPESELQHWQLHNIPPKGGPSDTFIRRQIDAEFADSDRPDHRFQASYDLLSNQSHSRLGFRVLDTLSSGDEHHLKGIRIPASNEQKEFDDLVLSLTKILVDYINEKNLKEYSTNKEVSGIGLLEQVLKDQNAKNFDVHITFLRGLQRLRSKGSAHRKGSDYQKLIEGHHSASGDFRSIFKELLGQAVLLLEFLGGVIQTTEFRTVETNLHQG
jgi:hypothetical protein